MHKIDIPDQVKEGVINRQGYLHAIEVLEPGKTALLVVDMQNYFMDESQQADGQLGCCPVARDIVPTVNRLAGAMRDAGGHVVWIQNATPLETLKSWANLHAMYSDEKREIRLEGMTRGSNGYALWGDLDVRPEDLRTEKTRYSAFIRGASDIEAQLRDRGVDTVIVTGVATNVCCESTARDAMMLGFRTMMVADANAAPSDAEHNAALATFMSFFGDVQFSEEIIEKLKVSMR